MARNTRNPSHCFRITFPELPGVSFFSIEDMYDGIDQAIAEQKAITTYKAGGCELDLRKTLGGFGWDMDDIKGVIAKPGKVVHRGFGIPQTLALAA